MYYIFYIFHIYVFIIPLQFRKALKLEFILRKFNSVKSLPTTSIASLRSIGLAPQRSALTPPRSIGSIQKTMVMQETHNPLFKIAEVSETTNEHR